MALTEAKELNLLQTANTIKLGVYYLLRCIDSSNNKYILSYNNVQVQLFEIAEETKENNILSCACSEIGGSQLKNIKCDNENIDILQFKKENETEIIKAMTLFYLNEEYCTHWNNMIGDFYAANLSAFDKINYSMPTKLKLQKWVEKRPLLVTYIKDSQIANNINKLAKYIKNIKGCTQKWYFQLYNVPFFTHENRKKRLVEDLIIEAKYKNALNILQNNVKDRYYPYYKHIYSIICHQYLYKQENYIANKKKYFLKMIELLVLLTQFMASSDSIICSLFADILLNYNPNELTESDWIFICDMVISGCCFMHRFENKNESDIDANNLIYHICGSIDSYLFLLYLIQKNKLTANHEIKRIIIHNMDELFAAFDNNVNNVTAMSVLYTVKIGEKRVLWKIKKEKIMQCIKEENKNTNDEDIDMRRQELICNICQKGPFKSKRALGSHKAMHTRAAKKHKTPKTYYQCRHCEHSADHKGNVKQHTLAMHKELKLNLKTAEPLTFFAPNKATIIKKKENKNKNNNKTSYNGMITRKRRQQMLNQQKCENEGVIILDNEVNEPMKKKQKRGNKNNFKCNLCWKKCRSPQGLGSHKRRCHGIVGNNKNNVRRNRRNNKNKKNMITIDDDG